VPKLIPLANQLSQKLSQIEKEILKLIEASTIKEFRNDPFSSVVFISPPYYWGETDENQKRIQMEIKMIYIPWIESFRLLFKNASLEVKKQIDETDIAIISYVEKNADWGLPATIEEAKIQFKNKIKTFYDLLRMVEDKNRRALIIVPDTNVLITSPDIAKYSEVVGETQYTVMLVPTVLSELDKLKITGREKEFRDKVTSVINRIKGLRLQGSLLEGVKVNKTITVKMIPIEPNFTNNLHWLDPTNNDDRIIASTLEIQRLDPSAIVTLMTSDINLQNKAEMANLPFVEPPGA